jgi:hypothetical protein
MRSVEIVATSLMASVAAECIYIHLAAGPIVRTRLELVDIPVDVPLTMRKLVAFHAPLTATTTVMMLGSPLVAWALAKSANPKTVLAAWQVSSTLAWLCRTVVFALPEVVITLYRDEQSAEKLRRFCLGVGLFTSGVLVLLAAFRLDVLFFTQVLEARPNVAEVAHAAFFAVALLPLIGAVQSYVRGMLTAHHLTVARFGAVMVAMAALGIFLFLTVALGIAGVVSASMALTGAMLAEFYFLAAALRKSKRAYTG